MHLAWVLGVPVAAFFFMAGALNLGAVVAEWSGSGVAKALFLPVSAVLGIGAWMLVLAAAWRLRRDYLRRAGSAVDAVVVESDLRCRNGRAFFKFDLWRVRVEAQFLHPDTGNEVRVRKEYFYHQFREARARALAEQLSVRAAVPTVVRKNYAMFDVPKRPFWTDIW
ncbi:hypothetical protein ACFXNW_05260 [Nocardia sp. NPDC059180]|uniref:hypothetical protein n=1 Tax=Nocardia sp. NPDC059180 TaxID=3346761 RepID=UPI0036B631E8